MIQKTTTKRIGVIAGAFLVLAMAVPLTFSATYNLETQIITKQMPDNKNITMWAYALQGGQATVPGPQLIVPPGDNELIVHLTNPLQIPVSIMIPGQSGKYLDGATWVPSDVVRDATTGRVTSFTQITPGKRLFFMPVQTRSYKWENLKPGTYAYHSGTHPAVQVQMGLYGAMTQSYAPGQSYQSSIDNPINSHDSEAVIIYSEIDPDIHKAAQTSPLSYTTIAKADYNPKYYLVNGNPKISESTNPIPTVNSNNDAVSVHTGETVLVRLLNLGLESCALEILGGRLKVIAEDGNRSPFSKSQSLIHLPAGKTKDALLVTAPKGKYSIFDRRLYGSHDLTTVLDENDMPKVPLEQAWVSKGRVRRTFISVTDPLP